MVLLTPDYNTDGTPDFESVKALFARVEEMIRSGQVLSAWTLGFGGVAEAVAKMSFGNRVGFQFARKVSDELLFNPVYGGFVLELAGGVKAEDSEVLGVTALNPEIVSADGALRLGLEELQTAYEDKLEPVFHCNIATSSAEIPAYSYETEHRPAPAVKAASPRVLIPVFPGTNCEYDTQRAFERAGATTDIFVINNLSSRAIEESVAEFAKRIKKAQIIMIPGGFSGGDEPDGSGKFITAFFRNPRIKDGVHELLKDRDGLMLGICNGFQALIKLGLVPYGEIRGDVTRCADPDLQLHRPASVQDGDDPDRLQQVPVAGEHPGGRLPHRGHFPRRGPVCRSARTGSGCWPRTGRSPPSMSTSTGQPTYDIRFNPNMSAAAIEGITSPDGRVLGKMAHSERIGANVAKNIDGDKDQMIFRSGVEYFR